MQNLGMRIERRIDEADGALPSIKALAVDEREKR